MRQQTHFWFARYLHVTCTRTVSSQSLASAWIRERRSPTHTKTVFRALSQSCQRGTSSSQPLSAAPQHFLGHCKPVTVRIKLYQNKCSVKSKLIVVKNQHNTSWFILGFQKFPIQRFMSRWQKRRRNKELFSFHNNNPRPIISTVLGMFPCI